MFLIAYVGTALLVTLFVMGVAAWIAKEKGKNPYKWAGLAFVGLFVLVFWDYYPTKWAHQHYCEKDSGFWVYKTLDQWKAENPGVMEGLATARVSPSTHQDNGVDHTTTYFLNQRFNWVVKKTGPLLLHRWRHEQVIVDTKTNDVLSRYVDFSTSQERQQAGWNGWKFWLANRNCSGGLANRYSADQLVEDISKLTKGEAK